MSNITLRSQKNNESIPQVEDGRGEAVLLNQERAKTGERLLKEFKEKNDNLISKLVHRRQSQVITKAEIDIVLLELESQKNEMDVYYTGRLKGLQKVIEQKLMNMNTSLHIDLAAAYKKYESQLFSGLNKTEEEFQKIIEDFSEKIYSYKIDAMRERAMQDLNLQIECFYNSKEKLVADYANLIDSLKFKSS